MSVTPEQHLREALSLTRGAIEHVKMTIAPDLAGVLANLTVAERELRVAHERVATELNCPECQDALDDGYDVRELPEIHRLEEHAIPPEFRSR